VVIDYLQTKFQNATGIGIAYLYCNFRQQHVQKPGFLLAGLQKQLPQEQTSMRKSMEWLLNLHKHKQTRLSFNGLLEELHYIITDYSRVFIINALGECQISNGSCKKILSEIFNLQVKIHSKSFCNFRSSLLPFPVLSILFLIAPFSPWPSGFRGSAVGVDIRAST
jgi:hypothetical protein